MKKISLLLLVAAHVSCAWASPVDPQQPRLPQTPRAMALALERETAWGIGQFMPDTNRTFMSWQGTITMPTANDAGFPQAFLDGLAVAEEYGVATWPVTLRVEDETGCTLFYNANGVCFWSEEPEGEWSSDWVLQLRCGDTTSPEWLSSRSETTRKLIAALLLPSHVEMRWVFVAEGDAEAYSRGRLAAQMAARGLNAGEGTRGDGPGLPGPELWITEFNLTNGTYNFTVAWNEFVMFPDEGKLEVWFAEELAASAWTNVAAFTVPDDAESLSFSLTKEEVFGAAIQPTFAHEPGCDPEVNTAPSPLDPNKIYTNTVCSCAVNWKSPRGFFRLKVPGTETVGRIPFWWKWYYGLDVWDDWDEELDLNGDGYSIFDAYLMGMSPIAPPDTVGVTGAVIQYDHDVDANLTRAFIGAEGAAVIRMLSPAGNAEVQQERSAP